ncbi:octanoyltransferase [Plakobranchus ocellatus]|uniref:lipoyl(octanoyl) transferase n=1 Tax=Plakobranchus ocellatus TaxID=259542 RepID=A0AAV4AA01_9GAST|nr:octanoyltransferase [Plakobranchus ocellatus]
MSSVANRVVSVVNLGRMGFMAAYDVQMRYVRNHLEEMAGKPHVHGENMLLLVEHTPVYTTGTRDKVYSADYEKMLKKTGAEFLRTNRGGLVTFHGPGQLVAYPILNLHHFKPSMKWYVCQLEETLIGTLRRFGITGRRTDQTGVWVDHRKIASIGLHGTRFVTSHGVALNTDVDLSWFSYIEACGLPGVEMTSLSKELDRNVPYQDAVKPFLRTFQEVFDCELEYKMLEEKELKSVSVPAPEHRGPELSAATPTPTDLKEVGLRHMSTLAGAQASFFLPFFKPLLSSSPSSLSKTELSVPKEKEPKKIDDVVPGKERAMW